MSDAQFNALAAGAIVYSAGDIILGGDGSDTIMGSPATTSSTATSGSTSASACSETRRQGSAPVPLIASYASMTELATLMFNGTYNPGQLKIVREIKTDTTAGDIDVAKFQGSRSEYAFGATADGQVIVTPRDRGLARRHRSAAQHRARAVRRRQPAQHHRRHAEQRRAQRHALRTT